MPALPRNDPRQYDQLAGEWWRPGGAFEILHWLAVARADLVPPAARAGAVLLDVACGAGLLAPHVRDLGYRHVGVDLTRSALDQAAGRAVLPVLGDAGRLPFADGCADVVVAGEILEHVPDLPAVVAELCRVLRPGGLLVLDTLNATALSRWLTITVGERVGSVPRGIHDPALYVRPAELTAQCARHGVRIWVRGLRPGTMGLLRWLVGGAFRAGGPGADGGTTANGRSSADPVGPPLGRMVPTRSTAVLYQALGRKGGGDPFGRPAPGGVTSGKGQFHAG